MTGKIPPGAFDEYVAMGPERSYRALAQRFGVSKRAVVKRAIRESWQERLVTIEREARERSDSRLVETVDAMNRRHLKILQAIQGRALEALKAMPVDSAMAAIRALDMTIRQERVVRGEPADRTAVTTEEVVRREYERWLTAHDPILENGEDDDGDTR